MKLIVSILSLCFYATGLFGQYVNIPCSGWKLLSVDCYQSGSEGEKAFDGDPNTHWHSRWGEENPLPHHLQIDLGAVYEVNGFAYLPRPDGGNGIILGYDFFVSANGKDWGKAVASGEFHKKEINKVYFPSCPGVRYVKLVARTEANGSLYLASVPEIEVFQKSDKKPEVAFSTPVRLVKTGSGIRFTDLSTVSPVSWEWSFPGGTPQNSTSQHPFVVYDRPGIYPVTLKVSNPNGTSQQTCERYIEVSDKVRNLAVCLDGTDNNLRIGMDVIKGQWTIEAWIKGNDNRWKETEVIIGAGEYGDINTVDPLPLVIKNGKLHSSQAGISSPVPLDDQWHHVAVSCDGRATRLFLDGKEVASGKAVAAILPGSVGVDTRSETTFGGLIDEVRIWHTGLSGEVIREWMGKPLTPAHTAFRQLKGYYTFDDMGGDVDVNRVGKGHQAYHLRSGRTNYYGHSPLAYTVVNENPGFRQLEKKQQIFNAVVVKSEWDGDRGAKDDQILKLRIAVDGGIKSRKLTELKLDLSGTTALSDVEKVHVYYTGQTARSKVKKELFGSGRPPASAMVYQLSGSEAQLLADGMNYFLVTFDLRSDAVPGHVLDVSVSSFKLDGTTFVPEQDDSCLPKRVTENSLSNPNMLKVLQWNIWHGGVHLGIDGRNRIKDMLRATQADIITIQEGYGAQQMLADSLAYFLQTPSPSDNLALMSRYPLVKIPSSSTFKSNPAKVTLPNGREILVSSCWLAYAYRPEYTVGYTNEGMNPRLWEEEDKILGLKDADNILNKDIKPYLTDESIPVIIGGDFNSGSHLDWTLAAAGLHNGYGPVDLPISKFMMSHGFRDSFRVINPDEVAYPGGTFAAIFGHLQTSRIDYIYYRGNGVRPVTSRILRTSPEIDDAWASDHAAVLTVFDMEKR